MFKKKKWPRDGGHALAFVLNQAQIFPEYVAVLRRPEWFGSDPHICKMLDQVDEVAREIIAEREHFVTVFRQTVARKGATSEMAKEMIPPLKEALTRDTQLACRLAGRTELLSNALRSLSFVEYEKLEGTFLLPDEAEQERRKLEKMLNKEHLYDAALKLTASPWEDFARSAEQRRQDKWLKRVFASESFETYSIFLASNPLHERLGQVPEKYRIGIAAAIAAPILKEMADHTMGCFGELQDMQRRSDPPAQRL